MSSHVRTNNHLKLGCLALALAFSCVAQARAQDGGMASKISHCELALTGHSQPDQPAESRVKDLEKGIFGKTSHGPLDKRLVKIQGALGVRETGTAAGEAPIESKPAPASVPSASASQPASEPPGLAAAAPPVAPSSVSEGAAAAAQKPSPTGISTGQTMPEMTTKQLLQIGTQKFAQGDTARAETIFQQVLERDPHNVDALFNLGALAERRGDLVGALGHYRRALELNPSDAELKEAVKSVEAQLAQKASQPGHQPLIGSAILNKEKPGQQFAVQTGQFGTPLLPVSGSPVFMGNTQINTGSAQVAPVTIPQLGVTPHNHHMRRAVVGIGVGVGFMALPAPLQVFHCPICRFISGF
jgi:hypothetical protein